MIIAVGRSKSLELLRILGVEVRCVEDKDFKCLSEEIRGSKAVIIEEDVYREYEDSIKRLFKDMKYPPLVVVIPGREGRETERLKDIYNMLSVAMGVKLKMGARRVGPGEEG